MVEKIILQNVLPEVFVDAPMDGDPSEVWQCDISFERGKSYLIEAASGRGKSSFCSFVYALRKDYRGTILYENSDGSVIDAKNCDVNELRRRDFAMMFQDLRLFPELTAVENILLKNQLTDFTTEEEIRNMLARLQLSDRMDRPCATLSLGQQQRVAFIRSLCQPASFILLDEPISHLDVENANIMKQMLDERREKDNVALIVTSIGYRLPYEYDNVYVL